MRTIKEEEVDLSDYRDFADAERQIRQFIEDVYNHQTHPFFLGVSDPG